MCKGNVYDINGFKYVAMDGKTERGLDLLLLVHISQVNNPSSGKWVAEKLIPVPLTKLNHFKDNE